MRILILRHGYYPRDPRVRREAAALVSRGHDVDVVCLREPGQKARESCGGVGVTRLPIRHRRAGIGRYAAEYFAFFISAALLTSWRHLRQRYDLVQVNTMPDVLVFAALAPKLSRTPVLLDLHEAMPELYAAKYGVPFTHSAPRALALLERAAIAFADACLAVSAPCRDRYVSRGATPGKLTIVMNSPDPELFGRQRCRRDVGPRAPVVVSHGTLVARYGYDLLIRALPAVADAHLEILGDGEELPRLEQLARELGVSHRVSLRGYVPLDRIAERLVRADVGVVANRRDAFTDLVLPTKLLEYVALGVPAVASRTPAIEAYFDDRAVTFFEPGDETDLGRVLAGLLADPARRQAQVRAATARLADFEWAVMAQRYVGLIDRLTCAAG